MPKARSHNYIGHNYIWNLPDAEGQEAGQAERVQQQKHHAKPSRHLFKVMAHAVMAHVVMAYICSHREKHHAEPSRHLF